MKQVNSGPEFSRGHTRDDPKRPVVMQVTVPLLGVTGSVSQESLAKDGHRPEEFDLKFQFKNICSFIVTENHYCKLIPTKNIISQEADNDIFIII